MNNELLMEMMNYYKGDPHQIQHLLKVTAFSKLIAEKEEVDQKTSFILEAAAIVHDIGIKKSMEVYGDGHGYHQEQLGPEIAEKMLAELGYEKDVIERVSYLVGHHHTYKNIEGMDYQILVEADFLVNIFEGKHDREYAINTRENIFKTATGIEILNRMFDLK